MSELKLMIGPERIILPEALQPFLIRTRGGKLVVTGQLPVPLGTAFPGVYGTAASDDGGETWKDPGIAGGSPFHEGCVTICATEQPCCCSGPRAARTPAATGSRSSGNRATTGRRLPGRSRPSCISPTPRRVRRRRASRAGSFSASRIGSFAERRSVARSVRLVQGR